MEAKYIMQEPLTTEVLNFPGNRLNSATVKPVLKCLRHGFLISKKGFCDPDPWQLMHLSQLISRERNPELREALEDLDEFMNGY